MSKVTIGHNHYRGRSHTISYGGEDRLRHTYMLGKTGVGKSTLFANLALQDIQNHHGVCFIDPHGESIDWLLKNIPSNRLEDVILFDAADYENPLGLNLLEARNEKEKDFLVSQVIEIFYKLFDPERKGVIGPQFEHWLRNAALTVMAGPGGGSLLEIPKLFIDKNYEKKKREFLTDLIVQDFWNKQMAKTSDFHRSEMLNYFSSKFGHFLNNSTMRNIVGQRKSAFNFDHILDREKILLVNLAKGKIGELNSQFLGLIIAAKLNAAVLARADIAPDKRYPFYLYVDEFQNVMTDTFASLLSESRKYGLGVHLTNQYFSQLPENIQDAVLGNTGTMIVFEIGTEDAEIMSRELAPVEKDDFLRLSRYNFYIKLMIDGKTSETFSGVSLPPMTANKSVEAADVALISQLAYGHPKALVEAQIASHLR